MTILHVLGSSSGLDDNALAEERPAWLTVPAYCGGVRVSVQVRTGRDPAAEILAAVRQDTPDLLVLGWRGKPGSGRYLVGRNLDPVVQYAPCDTAIVRISAEQLLPSSGIGGIERVLVPMGGGPNAPLALDMALALSPQVRVTALTVAGAAQGQVGLSAARERLDDILKPWSGEPRLERKVLPSTSPIKGILGEAGQGYDLVMMGASRESYVDRVLFGNIPQKIAMQSAVPTIVVKRHSRRVGFWLWRTVWRLYDLLPNLDLREQIEVYKTVREGAQPGMDFYVMIALSAAIATFGLMLNSPAVIIGAMLVAPLMAAIFGMSLSVVRGDLRLLRRSASATLRGVLLATVVAFGLALFAVSLTGPETALQSEVLGRTRPNLADLGVALASGAAGAYALCRKGVSASLPGVAIAAALVPPLGAVGIGIALGLVAEASMIEIAGGALLLFVTNLVAISAAGGIVFLWLGFRPLPGKTERTRAFQGGLLGTAILLVAVTIPLAILSYHSISNAVLERDVDRALIEEVQDMPSVELSDWDILPGDDPSPDGVELDDRTLKLQVWVRSPRDIAHWEVVDLQERVAGRLQRPVALLLSVIPTTQLDPFVPPTPTPTRTPTLTPPPDATATFTPSATSTPSATPTRTPSPTATATQTPTATFSPTPAHTPTSTATATPTSTHTPTATPTPTPTPSLASVTGTDGQGVWMYQGPALASGRVRALREGAVVTLVRDEEPVEADGYTWLKVRDRKGNEGWIPAQFLSDLTGPPS